MTFDWTIFLCALGLACVLESLPWLIAPERLRQALTQMLEQPTATFRAWGFFLLCTGLLLVWLARG